MTGGVFRNDEEGYEAWLAENPQGFVFNHFGGRDPGFNVLHRSGCRFLHRDVDEGRRTVYEKICCRDRKALERRLDRLRGPGRWKHCGVCF